MFDPKQPLWLPAGSVRAILAGILVVAMVVLQPDKVGELAAVVVAFYFASKAVAVK